MWDEQKAYTRAVIVNYVIVGNATGGGIAEERVNGLVHRVAIRNLCEGLAFDDDDRLIDYLMVFVRENRIECFRFDFRINFQFHAFLSTVIFDYSG